MGKLLQTLVIPACILTVISIVVVIYKINPYEYMHLNSNYPHYIKKNQYIDTAVLNGSQQKLFSHKPQQVMADSWSSRGHFKGRCIGANKTLIGTLPSFNMINSKPLSIVSVAKLQHLYNTVIYVMKNDIAGDIVECGVYRGGASLIVAALLNACEDARHIWLYDTFEGLPAPSHKFDDPQAKTKWEHMVYKNLRPGQDSDPYIDSHGIKRWNYETLESVKKNFQHYNDVNVKFVKGKVENSLLNTSQVPVGNIAILRLDTDWYTSTKVELEILTKKLSYGGVLIIDDYCAWKGSLEATKEFMTKHGDCFTNIVTDGDLCYHATRTSKECSFSV